MKKGSHKTATLSLYMEQVRSLLFKFPKKSEPELKSIFAPYRSRITGTSSNSPEVVEVDSDSIAESAVLMACAETEAVTSRLMSALAYSSVPSTLTEVVSAEIVAVNAFMPRACTWLVNAASTDALEFLILAVVAWLVNSALRAAEASLILVSGSAVRTNSLEISARASLVLVFAVVTAVSILRSLAA